MPENLTFDNNDRFKRKSFAERLTKVIHAFYPFYEEAFVLSLNAKFGSGKTTFLKMWENELKLKTTSSPASTVIYLNAWETDFDEEPLIPIISAIINSLETRPKSKTEKITKALKQVLGAAALTINELSPVDVDKIANRVEKENETISLENLGTEIYQEYSFKKTAYDTIKIQLEDYINDIEKKPLIILVDELDRVRPNYAVKFLEAVKHLFSIQGICFVLAIDKEQLQASIKQLYGNIDFENYYLRFITREVQLPETNDVDLGPFLEDLSEVYFDEKLNNGVKLVLNTNKKSEMLDFIGNIYKTFRFRPRQLEYLFRIFTQLISVETEKQNARISWLQTSVLLIAIYIDNAEFYHKIGQDHASPMEISQYIKTLNVKKNQYDYSEQAIIFLLLGFYIRDGEDNQSLRNEISDIALSFSNNDPAPDMATKRYNMITHLTHQVSDFSTHNYEHSSLNTIYRRIEDWQEFIR